MYRSFFMVLFAGILVGNVHAASFAVYHPLVFKMQLSYRYNKYNAHNVELSAENADLNYACHESGDTCPLYIETLKNTTVRIEVSDYIRGRNYCYLDLTNSNGEFKASLKVMNNETLICSTYGTIATGDFTLVVKSSKDDG